jgi:cobalt-zinc-cadmium resistance protein CzcA
VPASVGFIALLGIAVLNGVVLVSYFNQLLAPKAWPIARRGVEGALRRLRPVLMTASITAFGLVPLLFATGRARRSSGRWPSWSSAGWSPRRC